MAQIDKNVVGMYDYGNQLERTRMVDPNHVRIVQEALNDGTEVEVKMTIGELILYHVLLQNHGIDYTGENAFIPLMQRNKDRL